MSTDRQPGLAASDLWPWVGWYAVVVDDQVSGVHPDAAAAARAVAAVAGRPSSVAMFRVGGALAVAVPSADGGLPTAITPQSRVPSTPAARADLYRLSAMLTAESRARMARSDQLRRATLATLDRTRRALRTSHGLLDRAKAA